MFSEDAANEGSHLDPRGLALGPIDSHVPADGLYEFARDAPGRFVTQHLDRRVVDLERAVESQVAHRSAALSCSPAQRNSRAGRAALRYGRKGGW
jgi:hypothetical protein